MAIEASGRQQYTRWHRKSETKCEGYGERSLVGKFRIRWPYFAGTDTTVLLSIAYRKLSSVHENVFSANLKTVAIYTHCRVLADLAGGNVVLPAVPRARNDSPVHDPLAQWPTAMQAGIVDGVKLAPHIGQGNRFALHLELSNRSRSDFIGLRCSRKRHRV